MYDEKNETDAVSLALKELYVYFIFALLNCLLYFSYVSVLICAFQGNFRQNISWPFHLNSISVVQVGVI